jgi:hypothetical protein
MSTKTVAEKLLLRPGSAVWLSDATRGALIGPLPDGVRRVDGPDVATTAIVFADSAASLREMLSAYRDHLSGPSILWIAYPKGGRADINRDTLWPILADYGMRPNSQVALDDVWSALRFRANRPGEARFNGGHQPT